MMRASSGDMLRENIVLLESLIAAHEQEWNPKHAGRHMQVVLDGDEARQLIDDLREVLAKVEQEGDHGATTA